MIVVPLKAEHITAMDIQPAQRLGYDLNAEMLERIGDGFTGMIGDKVIFCMGRVKFWEGRYELWALLSADACKHMVWTTRVAKRLIAMCTGARRLEIIAKSDFPAARRWAEMLGFKWHHHEEKFLPDGADADIYVRIA